MSKFREGLRLTDECSRLIQSFSEKVRGGARIGMQFKFVPRKEPGGEWAKELFKKTNPERYAKIYPDDTPPQK